MFTLARSELLSTFFPTWIWQGRMWAKWRIPKYDPYYWIVADAHPVISTYYPVQIIIQKLSGLFSSSLDCLYKWFGYSILVHVFWAFIGWFVLFGIKANSPLALFGALTSVLAGYNWKQQPCSQYTFAWFPWLLYGIATHNILIASVSLGLLILAGYYPIGIQCCAIAVLATLHWHTSPLWIPIGVLIGLPQLIPFIKYLPKTIRANAHDEIGKVPWWNFTSLIFPRAFRYNINGVGFWEMSYYVGIIPLLTVWYTTSWAWVLLLMASSLMVGVCGKHLPRIPARWSYTFQFSLIWCALSGLANLNLPNNVLAVLCFLQCFDLIWNNKELLINRPYSELPNKPSWAFDTRLTRYLHNNLGDARVSGLPYPLFTGHINQFKTLGYSGGMQLKLMSKWRNDNNSNGSGEHDYFRSNSDDGELSRYRVKYAFTRKAIDWKRTQLPHLYENPGF